MKKKVRLRHGQPVCQAGPAVADQVLVTIDSDTHGSSWDVVDVAQVLDELAQLGAERHREIRH